MDDSTGIEVREGVSLSGLTTFRMGGEAQRLWVPRRGDDLGGLPTAYDGRYLVISGGSNLLVNDARSFPDVVSMGEYDDSVEHQGGGVFRAGASARIQRLIRAARSEGYGDIDELVSVPGLVGGLVCMNASVPSAGTCISDHLVEVEAFVDGGLVTYGRDECGFGYRESRFQDGRHIVLSATFRLPPEAEDEAERRARVRRERVRETQDPSHPNFGSVYRRSDRLLMALVRRVGLGCGGARFSRKATNWLLNEGGSFEDAMRAMRRVERLHALLGRRCEREVVVWG